MQIYLDTMDCDFKYDLGSIPIINPLETNFKEKITNFF